MPRNDIEQFIKKYLKPRSVLSTFLAKSNKVQVTVYFGVKWWTSFPHYNESYTSWVLLLLYCIKWRHFKSELFMVDIKWNGKNGKARTYTCTWDPTFFGDVHVITWTSLWLPITTVGISARDQLPGVWYPSLPFYLTHTTF